MSADDVHRIAEIVREETGNQVQEKNYAMIQSRMRTYVDRRKFESMAEYWAHYEKFERQERDAIAGLMTTHYTFFFREYFHFEVLEKWISVHGPRLKKRYQETKQGVQVWSAACSRGHEVYSLAMFLEERLTPLGIPYTILGSDIDQDSVAYSKNGVYPLKEVNAIPIQMLSKYARKGTGAVKDFAAIHPDLKKKTQFRTANLIDLPKDIVDRSFDVIFCRNVFIYFSEDKVKKIALSLANKLADDGLFASGISEPLRFPEWTLAIAGPSVYCKGNSLSAPAATSAPVAGTAASAATATSAAKAPAAAAEPAGYRVLCVDDSPTIQKLMTKIFKSDPACLGIDIANHGGEARAALDKKAYDLITLDIHMPEVNGIEFMEKLYRTKSDPPVIMISSVNRSDVDLATKSLSLGAFDYVEKPSMNQIEKSTYEILNKAKLAVESGRKAAKSGSAPNPVTATDTKVPAEKMGFDLDISKKVVVPDASRCLRLVAWSGSGLNELQAVLKGQQAEYRSPAIIIVAPRSEDLKPLLNSVQQWMGKPAQLVEGTSLLLRPNHVYLATASQLSSAVKSSGATRLSLQVLTPDVSAFKELLFAPSIQVLVSENLKQHKSKIEAQLGKPVSDITPATSFASLSVEYFALLRAAAA